MLVLVPHMRRYILLALAALSVTAAPSAAQQVSFSMRDGLVTLDARNATVRQILTEWTRVGRVAIINAEKVAGAPVTLQLAGVPERQALDIVLRGVAGYMVSARPATAPPDAALSRFEKVLILATSTAPPPTPATTAGNGPRAQIAPQPPPVVPDQDDDGDPADTPPSRGPVFQPGQPGQMGMPGNGMQAPPGAPGQPQQQGAPSQTPPAGPTAGPQGGPRFQNGGGGYPYPPASGPLGSTPRGAIGTSSPTPMGTVPSAGGAPGAVTPVPPPPTIAPTNPGVTPQPGPGPRPANP